MCISTRGNGWLSFALLVLGTACGGGDGGNDEAASLDDVKPYVTACSQTVCQKQATDCRAHEVQQCDDCFDSCSSPYLSDAASCASLCNDICSSSDCDSCAAPKDECATLGIRFEPPPLNTELRDLSLSELRQCDPSRSADDLAWSADFYGRAIRHEYAAVLQCFLAKGCDAYKECDTFAASGSVGTALCARQQACGAPCVDVDGEDTATYLNSVEPILRPALAAELARCARETDCATATACWAALQPAVGLANYPDP